MRYEIYIYTKGAWLRLDTDFESFERASAHLDHIRSNRELAASMGLPAPVKILPALDTTTAPDLDTDPSKFWTRVTDLIAQDDDALEAWLDLVVCEDWTDEDAEIAVALGVGGAALSADYRDYHIMSNLRAGRQAWDALGDPIDNSIAYWMSSDAAE